MTKAKAFHPQTMGVIYDCNVIKTRMGIAYVEFRQSIEGGKKKFWIPISHVIKEEKST
jgi:hypothetical protein